MSVVVYTAREARTRFAELLRRVRNGETVAVSYRGAPVAEIRPQAEAPDSPASEAAASALPTSEDGARGQAISPVGEGAQGQVISPVGEGAQGQAPADEEYATGQAVSPGEYGAGQAPAADENGATGQGGVDLSVFDFPPAPKDEEELEARLADMRRRGVLAPSSQPKRPFKPVCVVPGALERFLAERD